MKTQEVKLNNEVSIDLPKLIDSRLLVQANSGGGKSWLLRRILEQSHGKVQQIVIDLEGEFSTLREKFDYIVAGKGGDTPADPRSAGMLAKKLLELNVSAIIDLYELNHFDRKRFVKLFLEAMVNAPKELWHPCLVVIDEAHVFCPEKGQAESMEAVIDMATRGRKRGYSVVLATQRLSKLHKDAAAECNNKLIGRTGLDIDMKRASEELGFNSKEQYLSLRNLGEGEFYAFGPAISKEIIKVKVGEVKTTHPKAGSRILQTKAIPPTAKIKAVLSKLADLPAEVKKEALTISDLQNQIRNLTQENATLKRQPKVTDPDVIEKSVKLALEKQAIEFDQQVKSYKQVIDILNRGIELIGRNLAEINSKVSIGMKTQAFNLKYVAKRIVEKRFEPIQITSQNVKKLEETIGQISEDSEVKITGGALRMLKILVSRHPMKLTKSQLATFARLSPRSGTYSNYLSILRTAGFVTEDGDLFEASSAGIDYLGETPNPPQTSEEVIKMWYENLNGGAKRMFWVLSQAYPQSFSKEELGAATELIPSSGTFSNYLSILRSNELIEIKNGQIKLSENLFI